MRYSELFAGREDDHGRAHKGGYHPVGRPLTAEVLRDHRLGKISVGLYPIRPQDNTVRLVALDIDVDRSGAVKRLVAEAAKYVPRDAVVVEGTGGRGFHVWILFDDWFPASKAKAFGEWLVREANPGVKVETFPKQSRIEEGGFGNLIRLPLGKHPRTGREGELLDADMRPIETRPTGDGDLELIGVEPASPDCIPQHTVQEASAEPEPSRAKKQASGLPCIAKIREGVPKGQRDEAMFRLAIHLHREGFDTALGWTVMQQVNQRNQPPLDEDVLRQKLEQGFSGKYKIDCDNPVLADLCDPACPLKAKPKGRAKPKAPPRLLRAIEPDGTLVETLWDPYTERAKFAIRQADGSIEVSDRYRRGDVVYVPRIDEFVLHGNVLLASEVGQQVPLPQLLGDIQTTIRSHVEMAEHYERVATIYVVLTWLYDSLGNVPYLRALGDPGSGKTRFLNTVGALCLRATNLSGAISESALFRAIDLCRGTTIIDEGDWSRRSELWNSITKILNVGHERSGWVYRSTETTSGKGFEPEAFHVYGPKLIASRGRFGDDALESRCLTHVFKQRTRRDIPISLPPLERWDEAITLRNRLLRYRFDRWRPPLEYARVTPADLPEELQRLEPRFLQIIYPLYRIAEQGGEGSDCHTLLDFAAQMAAETRERRAETQEALLLQALKELVESGTRPIFFAGIVNAANDIARREGKDELSSPKASWLFRDRLGQRTRRVGGKSEWVQDLPLLESLLERYGIEPLRMEKGGQK